MIEKISNLGFEKTVDLIKSGGSGVVLCCTMNEIVMASKDGEVREAMDRADILTPDGMPLVWYMRWKNGKGERVYGPDIMNKIIFNKNIKQFFIGDKNNEEYFKKIGEYLVLPYKDKFNDGDYKLVANIVNKISPDVVWVGLGARKQVLMADGLKRWGVDSSIVTVGAGFDFLSGNKVQAPVWIRSLGGEWIFRMLTEPKRLVGRYLKIMVFGAEEFLFRIGVGKKWR